MFVCLGRRGRSGCQTNECGLRKADQPFRLRLHSGLRQSGAHLSGSEAVAKMGHRLWLGEMWVTGLMPRLGLGGVGESACRDVMPGPPRHPASFYNQVPDQDVFA